MAEGHNSRIGPVDSAVANRSVMPCPPFECVRRTLVKGESRGNNPERVDSCHCAASRQQIRSRDDGDRLASEKIYYNRAFVLRQFGVSRAGTNDWTGCRHCDASNYNAAAHPRSEHSTLANGV